MSKTLKSVKLSDKEIAFITLVRSLKNGTLEKVGVVNGEPQIVVCVTQRLDLSKPDELAKALALPLETLGTED